MIITAIAIIICQRRDKHPCFQPERKMINRDTRSRRTGEPWICGEWITWKLCSLVTLAGFSELQRQPFNTCKENTCPLFHHWRRSIFSNITWLHLTNYIYMHLYLFPSSNISHIKVLETYPIILSIIRLLDKDHVQQKSKEILFTLEQITIF